MAPRGMVLLSVAVAMTTAGCEQDLADRPCPCSDGWVCSPATSRCEEGEARQKIDDMQQLWADGNDVNGYWYTYSDKTVPNSLPVRYDSDAGFVSPSEDSPQFDASSAVDGPTPPGSVSQPYRRIDAGGESDWGVGFGMDFLLASPDGGPIPFDECDAGDIWDGGYIPQPFDASEWTGIEFYARSFGDADVKVEVHVDDDRTSPWGQVPFDAGGCNACFSKAGYPHACSDSFSNVSLTDPGLTQEVVFPAGRWTQIHVPFSWLHSGNWAKNLPPATPIHTNKIYNLHFQVSTTPHNPVPPFSIGVGYIFFYKKD